MLDWLAFVYLSFAQVGREGENRVQLTMVVNNHLTSKVRIIRV